MLKSVWDKAVHQYQTFRQKMAHESLKDIDASIEAAKNGHALYIEHFAYGMVPLAIAEPVSPAKAAQIVANDTKLRDDTLRAIAARRTKYNLDF